MGRGRDSWKYTFQPLWHHTKNQDREGERERAHHFTAYVHPYMKKRMDPVLHFRADFPSPVPPSCIGPHFQLCMAISRKHPDWEHRSRTSIYSSDKSSPSTPWLGWSLGEDVAPSVPARSSPQRWHWSWGRKREAGVRANRPIPNHLGPLFRWDVQSLMPLFLNPFGSLSGSILILCIFCFPTYWMPKEMSETLTTSRSRRLNQFRQNEPLCRKAPYAVICR